MSEPATPPAGELGPRLAGKVCIVTGAGSRGEGVGNGRATAILFARHGARVVLVDREASAAEATLATVEQEGGEAVVFAGDVTDEETCGRMVDAAVGRWGRLDVLVNNVGIEGPGTVTDVPLDAWQRILSLNVLSMVTASRRAVPAMLAAGGGAIVNISSIAAFRPHGLTPYSTSKGAVIALTRAMAVDHGAQGIRVNCVAPGPVYTPMVYAGGMSDDLREARRTASVLKIEGMGWDIGRAVLFLASDEARYVTGVVLPVDGGVSLTSAPR